MPSFHEIRNRFGGDDEGPWFIIHSNGLIHAVCLRADLNPNATSYPAEVWVPAKSGVASWGDQLALDTGAVELFVSPRAGEPYSDLGVYVVTDSTQDPARLEQAMATPGVGPISRIVYLTPAELSSAV
jgi:hypothetical protein